MCAVCHTKCARKSREGARSTFQSSTSLTQATDRAHAVKPPPLMDEDAFKGSMLPLLLNCSYVFVFIHRIAVLPVLPPVGRGQHKTSHNSTEKPGVVHKYTYDDLMEFDKMCI